jgi:salicylate hydroxylase
MLVTSRSCAMFLNHVQGIRSVIRDAVGGGTPIQTISPFSAYNVDIPRSLLSVDPTLSRLLTESNFWLGPSQIVAAVNMPDLGDKMNICLISEEGEGKEGEWYTLGDLGKVKKKFAHFAPVVRKMLELAKPEDCYIWRLSEMPPLERWVSESGKVVIVGDAGHAMLPYANQACLPGF